MSTAAEYGSDKPRSVVVREGDHLRLRCAANGFPQPAVEWVRQDEKTISSGAWEASSMPGHTLNITKVNRVHMGMVGSSTMPFVALEIKCFCNVRSTFASLITESHQRPIKLSRLMFIVSNMSCLGIKSLLVKSETFNFFRAFS